MGKKTRQKTRQGKKEAPEKPIASGPAILQRIRHADASIRQAALAGILHAQLLHSTKDSTAKLLLAVREQYMGSDQNCALAAAECLSDYLELAEQVDEQLTAGWVALVVDRLQTENPFLPLVFESLQMLALLIEDNPVAMNRLINNKELRETCLQRILYWLEASGRQSQSPTEVSTGVLLSSIRTISARCLESLLQDNPELFEELFVSESIDLLSIFQALKPNAEPVPATLTTMSQLHLVGAWLSAWSICKSHGGDEPRLLSLLQLLESQLDGCVKSLAMTIQNAFVHHDQCISKLEQLSEAYQEWQADLEDQEMDRDIIRKVNARKEPARAIVRRHAQQRQDQQQQPQTMDTTDKDCQQDEAPSDNAVDCIDKEQVWRDLFQDFVSEEVKPVSLALELTANLLLPLEDDGDAVMGEASTVHPVTQGLTEQHEIIKNLYDLMSRTLRFKRTGDDSAATQYPLPVQDLLCSIASKLGTCLTHALQHLPSFKTSMTLWHDLYQSLSLYPVSGVSHAMVLCLQKASTLTSVANETHVVLNWLQTEQKKCLQHADIDVVTRDMICMLGCLCASEGPLSEVACVLVETTTPEDVVSVRAERLNVLIDLFAEDDRHGIFMETGLLSYFQKELPVLQRQLSVYRDGDDVDFVQETATNAAHFIQYKKGAM